MKKGFIVFGLFMVFGLMSVSFADCSCTDVEIMSKINNAPSYEKDRFIQNFFMFGSSAKSKLVREIKDTPEFKNAIKNYIERECTVTDGKIKCNW